MTDPAYQPTAGVAGDDFAWVARMLADPQLLRMGHAQRAEDLNLGLGWLYYSLTRMIRPRKVVVIGSFRGFTPIVFGHALRQNNEGGRVLFLDPGLVDDHWRDPERVSAYFASHGLTNIDHRLLTTQAFAGGDEHRALRDVGIVFVDGYHSREQAKFDFETFWPCLASNGVILLHDSNRDFTSRIYGADRAYVHDVDLYVDELRGDPRLQVFDFTEGRGVAMVRRASAPSEAPSPPLPVEL